MVVTDREEVESCTGGFYTASNSEYCSLHRSRILIDERVEELQRQYVQKRRTMKGKLTSR